MTETILRLPASLHALSSLASFSRSRGSVGLLQLRRRSPGWDSREGAPYSLVYALHLEKLIEVLAVESLLHDFEHCRQSLRRETTHS
jgi:hypothetical protein